MATALTVEARAFLAGERSRDSLVRFTEATPSGGPDDQLIGVILGNSVDQSADKDLRLALAEHFDRGAP
jgi:hypothetical protein